MVLPHYALSAINMTNKRSSESRALSIQSIVFNFVKIPQTEYIEQTLRYGILHYA